MKIRAFLFLLFASSLAVRADDQSQGIVQPFKQISVPSPVLQEIITEMVVDEGSEVKEGQVLVQLRNDRETLDVQLSDKLIDLKRFIAIGQEKLYNEKMGSEEKSREAKTELELAELTLKAKKLALDEKTIRSTMNGVVVRKYKESGESVDRQEKLLDIMNYDQVYVQFFVKPEFRKGLAENAPAKVKIVDLDNAAFEGKITFIDPRNEAASGMVRLKVLLDNKDHRIKPGMKSLADFAPKP